MEAESVMVAQESGVGETVSGCSGSVGEAAMGLNAALLLRGWY